MALKLKDEPVSTIQKTGSDYINRDYSKMADDILKGEEELPESRYSSSNTYQSMHNDMKGLDAKFELDDYTYQYKDRGYSGFSKFDTGRTYPRLNWFSKVSDDPTSLYICIVVCAVLFFMFLHRGMSAVSDLNRDTVEVEAIVTSVDHKEEYVKRGRRSGRWVDRYRTTYEWVGENGEIQTNTRIYDERKFSVGDTAIVTVSKYNLNEEIDSKSTAKGKAASGFSFSIGAAAVLALCSIRLKKIREE